LKYQYTLIRLNGRPTPDGLKSKRTPDHPQTFT
jgi:hypothetical protein